MAPGLYRAFDAAVAGMLRPTLRAIILLLCLLLRVSTYGTVGTAVSVCIFIP